MNINNQVENMKLNFTTGFIGLLMLLPAVTQAQLREEVLKNKYIELRLTPDAGGRVLSVALHQHPNFLKTGDAVQKKPLESVNENTPFIPYFGHEVWFGPQKAWWADQTLLPKRKKQLFAWPPDPFSSLSANQLITKTDKKIVLKSPASPINGLQIEKTFELVADNPYQIDLWVNAKNTRSKPVAWDIWFNTRTFSTTRIYAPVNEKVDVGRLDWDASVPYIIQDRLLSLQLVPVESDKKQIKGKVFFQPSEGWFAAFNQRQLLIVQFPYLSIEKIHPDQGQLEFYLEYDPANEGAGILEMEVHSAYKKLEHGEEMQARERWTLIEYSGDGSVEAQRKFLMRQLKSLKKI